MKANAVVKSKIKTIKGIVSACVIFIVGLFYLHHGHAGENQTDAVIELHVNGAIGPAVADYLERGIIQANQNRARLVLIQIDTPGGLSTSMRLIIQSILNSSIPVVTYVSPSGARAASAGTYILYASHVAAMAPGTNVGASTPVGLGVAGSEGNGKDKSAPSTEEAKATSDASAYIRSLAQLRGRNVEWAVKSVLRSESLSANEALKQNVIDVIAKDRADLLNEINGREVKVAGIPYKLDTSHVVVKEIQISFCRMMIPFRASCDKKHRNIMRYSKII